MLPGDYLASLQGWNRGGQSDLDQCPLITRSTDSQRRQQVPGDGHPAHAMGLRRLCGAGQRRNRALVTNHHLAASRKRRPRKVYLRGTISTTWTFRGAAEGRAKGPHRKDIEIARGEC